MKTMTDPLGLCHIYHAEWKLEMACETRPSRSATCDWPYKSVLFVEGGVQLWMECPATQLIRGDWTRLRWVSLRSSRMWRSQTMFSLAKRIRSNSVAWMLNLWKGSTNGQEYLLLVHSIQSHVSSQCWATEEVDVRRPRVCLQPKAQCTLRYLKGQTISQSAAELTFLVSLM